MLVSRSTTTPMQANLRVSKEFSRPHDAIPKKLGDKPFARIALRSKTHTLLHSPKLALLVKYI